MVRSRKARAGLLALAALVPLLLVEATVFGQSVPPTNKRLLHFLLLTPTLYGVFALLAVVAPLVAGGGNELFPEGQLAAYPIQPRTVFSGSVLMAPLNLAWVMQLVMLTGTTAADAARGPRVVLAIITSTTYVVLATIVGQAVGWGVIGVRQRRRGRDATRVVAILAALTALGVFASGRTIKVLDHAPTTRVVVAALAGSEGRYGRWALTTGVLVVLGFVAHRLGVLTCAWTLRRTAPVGTPELQPVLRRPARATALRELVTVDRASVWRSTPLRRGVLVLAVLPGTVATLAHPTWVSLTLLPGLVAAGAGLLFGVNAFCLDGSGALWVSSLPHPPRTTFIAKLVVIAQTCLAATVIAVAMALTRIRAMPTPAEALAVAGSVLGASLLVVATCGRLSVTRPHKADLRGPRDTPAPPASMAVYSLRLALGTTWAGLVFAAASASGSVGLALAASAAVLCAATLSLVRTLGRWDSPVLRAHVITTVSSG